MFAPRLTRRRFLSCAAATATGCLTTGLYAWQIEPYWVVQVSRLLPLHNLPQQLIDRTLVQLSDLHIGFQVNDDYLRGVFKAVKQLRPEFVVMTGDLTSYHRNILPHAESLLADFPRGSLATLGVLGNHDYGLGARDYCHAGRLAELAAASGLQLLRNERVDVEGLAIVGADDLWANRFDVAKPLRGLANDVASVALSHNPDTADLPGWGGYRGWVLAGHTHGGQCKLPFLNPPLLPVKNRRYVAGEYALAGGRRMYINRGVGHLLPVRFNVRPEVTIFRLTRA